MALVGLQEKGKMKSPSVQGYTASAPKTIILPAIINRKKEKEDHLEFKQWYPCVASFHQYNSKPSDSSIGKSVLSESLGKAYNMWKLSLN